MGDMNNSQQWMGLIGNGVRDSSNLPPVANVSQVSEYHYAQ